MVLLEWERGAFLGKGSFGCVNLVRTRNHGLPTLVVKSTLLSNFHSFKKEMSILPLLQDCPQIVRCFGVDFTVEHNQPLCNLFLEYVSGGTLADIIDNLIRSCVMEGALRQGQEIHAHLIKFRHRVGARTIAALVVLYEKCDKMAAARLLFDELLVKEVGLWGRLISGYVRNGLNQEALELYCEMVSADIELNPLVISSVLNACIGILGLAEGKQIQSQSIKSGYWLYKSLVIDGLAKLYSRCGQVKEANKLMKCR